MKLSKEEIMVYIQNTDFIDVEVEELKTTEYFTAYKNLGFNEGVLLKCITKEKTAYFKEVLDTLDKEIIVKNYSGWFFNKVSRDINDFIFYLFKHKDLQSWDLEVDGAGGFTDIMEEFDNLLDFRKLGCYEIDKSTFQDRLVKIALDGSCYGTWKYDKEETTRMAKAFIDVFLNIVITIVLSVLANGVLYY